MSSPVRCTVPLLCCTIVPDHRIGQCLSLCCSAPQPQQCGCTCTYVIDSKRHADVRFFYSENLLKCLGSSTTWTPHPPQQKTQSALTRSCSPHCQLPSSIHESWMLCAIISRLTERFVLGLLYEHFHVSSSSTSPRTAQTKPRRTATGCTSMPLQRRTFTPQQSSLSLQADPIPPQPGVCPSGIPR